MGADKYKLYEIYRKICDVCGEACLSQKNLNKSAKYEFGTMSLSQLRQFVEWKHTRLFGKEKVLGTTRSKVGHAYCVLVHKRNHHFRFP